MNLRCAHALRNSEALICFASALSAHWFIMLQGIEIFQEEEPGALLSIIEFTRTTVILPEDVVDIFESLFEHGVAGYRTREMQAGILVAGEIEMAVGAPKMNSWCCRTLFFCSRSCLLPSESAPMKRDMEIIRLLLLQQETGEDPPELKHIDQQLLVYNTALMLDAGLIVGDILPDHEGSPRGACIIRMTWAGHDFLDSVRDPMIWKLAKERVLKPGASWSFSLLVEYLKSEAKQRIGLG